MAHLSAKANNYRMTIYRWRKLNMLLLPVVRSEYHGAFKIKTFAIIAIDIYKWPLISSDVIASPLVGQSIRLQWINSGYLIQMSK